MPRKVRIEQGTTLTTKTNDQSDSVYEITFTVVNFSNNRVQCTITERKSSKDPRTESFTGKFRLKKKETVFIAILKEDDFGVANVSIRVVASDSHALRDRIFVKPRNFGDLLDSVEQVPDPGFAPTALLTTVNPFTMGGGQQTDPEAESFQRQGQTTTAPMPNVAGGVTTTGNQTGQRIQQGTVIVRDQTNLPVAYDVPTIPGGGGAITVGQMFTYAEAGIPPLPTMVGSVTYGPPWNVTLGGAGGNPPLPAGFTSGYVEGIRTS